jgi:primosomal protein N' (replication factor Y)
MDIDTTSGKGAHEKILQQFKNRGADILLGTQMISKGLDFENVSLVGVINADIGLTLPDFRSAERIFQLLTQVAGRPGRSKSQGRVVIQTSMENHYAIIYARTHDYHGFYKCESEYREERHYPPITRLIKIGINSKQKQQAAQRSTQILNILKKNKKRYFKIIGPAPSPLIKLNNKYRWHILVKIDLNHDPTGRLTRKVLRNLLVPFMSTSKDKDQVYVDVDPIDMM